MSAAPSDPLTSALSDPLSSAAAEPPAAAAEPPITPPQPPYEPLTDVRDADLPPTSPSAGGGDGGDGGNGGSVGGTELPAKLAAALEAVEADAFFCFTNLMAELRDHFCSKLDHTALGITAKVTMMEQLIRKKDPEVGRLLARLKVSPTFYGFRWITLLMTQEWDLPDVIRLWDTLLSDPRRFEFLLYFCPATVLSIRGELLAHDDFAFAVKALQRFEARVPMHALLRKAHAMYREDQPALWAK